jgi:hypothetical protein
MPDDAIFLLHATEALERVPLTAFDAEEVLQRLIAQHPALLAGDQIDPDDPPRWLLLSREAGIPDAAGGASRWAVDHLLLDQNGRPTFVEVKRSSDSRIRREVVGQMLDYAANAVAYWPADRLRATAGRMYGDDQGLLHRALAALLGEELLEPEAVEQYWRLVEDNLRSGKVRLLFVADEIPRELRRLIEFLNENMPRVDVLGVEIRQFAGANIRALVPRVVGLTERARDERLIGIRSTARRIGESDFLEGLPDWLRAFYARLLDQASKEQLTASWGTKGFGLRSTANGRRVTVLYGYPPGTVDIPEAFIEVLDNQLGEDDRPGILHEQLAKLPDVTRHGRYTHRLKLTPATASQAERLLAAVWEQYRRLV